MRFGVLAVLVIFMIACTEIGYAQDVFSPPSQKKIYSTTLTSSPINIDGVIDESAWKRARVIDDFVQKNPNQGAATSYKTEVRVLYDNEWLYISAVCYQPSREKVVQNLERDFNFFQNDLFGIAIDGFLDQRNSVVFQVTPLGNVRDAQVVDGKSTNEDWDATWNAETSIHANRWEAEIAIPWKILRYPETANQLGVIFARNIRHLNEINTSPALPRSLNEYRMEYAGLLDGISPPPPTSNIQVNPYVLGDFQRVERGTSSSDELEPKLGSDIKWGINSTSVLDLTFNTDFAQAEADAQVINLNRFSVFFPEKRPFFLENSDLFSANVTNWIRPFFSRRIGLANNGTPIPIDAGARYVNQSSKEQFGALVIRQRAMNANPASNFGVLRYSRNVSKNSRLGTMATYRNDQSTDALPSNNNFTFTLDGFFRPSPSFAIQSMISASKDDLTGNGLAGQFYTYYRTNGMYIGFLEYYNRSYNPGVGLEILNDNFVMTSPALNFDLRPNWLPKSIRSYNPGGYAYIFNSSDNGEHLFSYAGVSPIELNFHNGARFAFTIEPNWQDLDQPFYPIGIEIAPGSYTYTRYYATASTNPATVLSTSLSTSFGSYFDGTLERYTLALRVAPIPHFELNGSYQITYTSNLGVQNVDSESQLIRIEPKIALNPKLLFSGMYQWNEATNQHFWNTRISWEFKPLSYFYLVFNNSLYSPDDPQQRLQQQQYITKLSYVHQF